MRHLSINETVLSGHREFGDSNEIVRRTQVCLRRRLDHIADHLPAARRLAQILDSVDGCVARDTFADTLIRCAVNHSWAHLGRPTRRCLSWEDCIAIFERAADHLCAQRRWNPQICRDHVEERFVDDRRGWVWSPSIGDPAFEQAFQALVFREYGRVLHAAGATEIAVLRQGRVLLRNLLPTLSVDVLRHVSTIAFFAPMDSMRSGISSSQFRLAGTIFLSREVLADQWQVCEILLHESLHQKLYDLRFTHSLFRPVHEIKRPALISPPWTGSYVNGAQHWNVFRAFAAFHVYVHLVVLARRIAEFIDGRSDPVESHLTRAATAVERARYLGETIERRGWDELGEAGHRFHGWLTSVLDHLDPTA